MNEEEKQIPQELVDEHSSEEVDQIEEKTENDPTIDGEGLLITNKYEESKESKKLKRRYLKLLIYFITSTIVYYICKAFDPFKNLQGNAEVQTNEMFTYIRYVMIASIIISLIGIVLLVLTRFKLNFKLKKETLKRIVEVFEWIVILPICVAVSSFFFSFVFTITVVDGSSMQPTLYPNEQLLLTYDSTYERFDVVVIDVKVEVYENLKTIYNNDQYETLYVKRIIGMPGDYIEYREINDATYLYINGIRVEESFFNGNINNTYYESLTSMPFDWQHVCDISAEYCADNGNGQLVIPDGYYFVLGDNRHNSVDSRKMGLIREEDIIGIIKYRVNSLLDFEKIE